MTGSNPLPSLTATLLTSKSEVETYLIFKRKLSILYVLKAVRSKDRIDKYRILIIIVIIYTNRYSEYTI